MPKAGELRTLGWVALLVAGFVAMRSETAWGQADTGEPAREGAQVQEAVPEGQSIVAPEDGQSANASEHPEPETSPEAPGRGGRLVSSGDGTAFGVGLGLVNLPQEADFEGEVPSFDLSWTGYSSPWWNYRFGLNHTSARFERFALSTNALYIAYLARVALSERFDLHAALGAAFHMATLQTPEGDARTASGIGPLFGAGMRYGFDSLVLGLQFLVLTHTAGFDGVTVATGSNQLQLTLEFPLD